MLGYRSAHATGRHGSGGGECGFHCFQAYSAFITTTAFIKLKTRIPMAREYRLSSSSVSERGVTPYDVKDRTEAD